MLNNLFEVMIWSMQWKFFTAPHLQEVEHTSELKAYIIC